MKLAAFLALTGSVDLAECHRFRSELAGKSAVLQSEGNAFNFLHLGGAFTDCSNPTILDANSMGVTSFQGASQTCTSNSNCSFFMLNTDEGKLYLCPDSSGFLHASPSTSWIIGVKPSALDRAGYKVSLNKQAICKNVISKQTVTSIDEAEVLARSLQSDVFSLNLNKGAAAGPSVPSMVRSTVCPTKECLFKLSIQTAFFCHGASE
ncbi:conserved hypothetical protein [Neospora caninum Liverpool]|uniref:Uncharacterized protein n=1 Tax=Neospora caninum (strain Liverpool) TaxID=572307 RepID=F0VP56_NEOCL|nr:conserved hypothetical protein [Neospora caninum Liverpool]CBZ55502.1 conserved hypothetical protein [Neospora caninum Liverpool]CEL70240.1 TPA: hypothetical protein BN1204_059270 [Neospora caninum Liverpool]|eukprot:XP_003885530.1 conserved hypothetical protein [Neospora caninum Liverpool]